VFFSPKEVEKLFDLDFHKLHNMTNVFVQNMGFYCARFSIQSLFKTTPCPLKRQRENHTGVLASDSSHEYTVDRRSIGQGVWQQPPDYPWPEGSNHSSNKSDPKGGMREGHRELCPPDPNVPAAPGSSFGAHLLSVSETKSFCRTDLKLWTCLLHRLDRM